MANAAKKALLDLLYARKQKQIARFNSLKGERVYPADEANTLRKLDDAELKQLDSEISFIDKAIDAAIGD